MTSPTEPTAAEASRPQNFDPLDFTAGSYSGDASPPTHTVTPVPQPQPKVHLKFEPAEGSRASALLTQLPHLEADKREAEARLDECKAALMSEIAATVTDAASMPDGWSIPADPHGGWPAYNLTSNPGKMGLDTKALKTEEPQTYDKFAKRGKPYWSLTRVQRQRVKR